MSTITIPAWRPRLAGGKAAPIGGRSGKFRVLEISINFGYTSGKPNQDRDFEFTLRVPLTRRNRRRSDLFWQFVAQVKMEELGIHVQSGDWDEAIIGYRYTGRTDSYKPRYNILNKQTKWCRPEGGGWSTLWVTPAKQEKIEKRLARRGVIR